ncbi:DUF1697 domain-containing protein [Massilia glaciei]|uniref:DUF1697 domain-containing protein n=1 Tax=Massilia glaciei TaxID=1524097 RepID=A0A2U2HNW9_9BURK|nr:DUF1697 domain-containing protein [Massilia glaciei]PWF49169.1 DUF1697 domain-containing protein [Massilia glaciei]
MALPSAHMTQYIALLRGINVGKAKRVAMLELRALMEELGHTAVSTVLNSGNVVFNAARTNSAEAAAAIEKAIESHFKFPVPVIVITARELHTAIAENPFPEAAATPSQYLVAFAAAEAPLVKARELLAQSWTPDALAFGDKTAYLWCAGGILASALAQAFTRAAGAAITTRNWATVLKLQAATTEGKNPA